MEQITIKNILLEKQLDNGLDALKRQETHGYRPTARFDSIPFSLPFNWGINPFNHDHWMYQLSAMRPVVPYLVSFELSGDLSHLRSAIEIYRDWDSYYRENRPNKYTWYNMAVGQRGLRLAYILDQLTRIKACESYQFLYDMALVHMRWLMDEKYLSTGNHGLFQAHGLMGLSKALSNKFPDLCVKAKDKASNYIENLIFMQFNNEGMHLEHSSAYHFFALRVLRQIFSSGWYASNEFFNTITTTAPGVGDWFTRPDGIRVTNGDSGIVSTKINDVGYHHVIPFIKWKIASVRLFNKSGYFFLKSTPPCPLRDSYMLFLSGGYHSKVHKHSDDLHFELFDFGTPILIDSGGYGNVRDSMRNYVKSPRAHNTIEKIGGKALGVPLCVNMGLHQ